MDGSVIAKCAALRDEFFPPMVDTLTFLLLSFLHPILINLRASFHHVTFDEITVVFHHIPPHSAPSLDAITYQVLREAHFAAPSLLPTLFTALLNFRLP